MHMQSHFLEKTVRLTIIKWVTMFLHPLVSGQWSGDRLFLCEFVIAELVWCDGQGHRSKGKVAGLRHMNLRFPDGMWYHSIINYNIVSLC